MRLILAALICTLIGSAAPAQSESAADLLSIFEMELEGKKDLPVPLLCKYMKKLQARGQAATPDLIRAIDHSKRWEVRYLAVSVLEKTRDPRAIPALVRALRDRTVLQHSFNGWGEPRSAKHRIRSSAADALKAIGARALQHLKAIVRNRRHKDRADAVYALRVIGDRDAIQTLLKIAKDRTQAPGVRRDAVWGIAGGKARDVQDLSVLLRDPKMRSIVVKALTKEARPNVLPGLTPLLREALTDYEAAKAAAQIMSGVCKARRSKWKPQRVEDHVDWYLLARRSRSITYDVKRPALPRLAHWTRSQHREMRSEAIKALGLFRKQNSYQGTDAGQVLLHLLDHPDKDVRMDAVWAMREKRDYRVMDYLIDMLGTDAANQKRCYQTLRNWTRQDFGMDVEKWLAWWQANRSSFRR